MTNHLTFRQRRPPAPASARTRASSSIRPPWPTSTAAGKPEIIVGSNEEYAVGDRRRGSAQRRRRSTHCLDLGDLARAGVLKFANGRVYAIQATGREPGQQPVPARLAARRSGSSTPACCPTSARASTARRSSRRSAALRGGGGLKVGVTPDAGPGLHPQPRRQLVLRADRRGRQHAADRLRARAGQVRPPDLRRCRLSRLRVAQRALDRLLRAGGRPRCGRSI